MWWEHISREAPSINGCCLCGFWGHLPLLYVASRRGSGPWSRWEEPLPLFLALPFPGQTTRQGRGAGSWAWGSLGTGKPSLALSGHAVSHFSDFLVFVVLSTELFWVSSFWNWSLQFCMMRVWFPFPWLEGISWKETIFYVPFIVSVVTT